ncbi:MAG: MMPL family transporter [Elusimicrobia bacterium]|nr:MMPL family transporter [Elusimicrobiota bacterium]
MRDKLLKILAQLHSRYPLRVLAAVFILTACFGYLATKLQQNMRWADLLPENHPSTVQFNKVVEEFTSATNIVVMVEGEEEKIKRFADEAVPLFKDLIDPSDGKKYIKRIDYRAETGFIKKHGLMLVKEEDMEDMKGLFMDPNLLPLVTNINDSLEKVYIAKEGSMSTREKEDNAFIFLDGIENLVRQIQRSVSGERLSEDDVRKTADKILFGEDYMLSYGKDALIILAVPNFTMMDMDKVTYSVDSMQEVIDGMLPRYEGVKAGLTGMVAVQHDENVSIEKSLGYTTVIALAAVLAMLIIAFRMWMAPLYGLLTLIVGVIWAVGLVTVTLGSLNMMSAMMAVILIGLGIDFSIHIISVFTENRSLGKGIEESLSVTFRNTGKGIITGALTTAAAFFAVTIARTRGMKEMGIVLGGGVIMVLLATFLLLPALLVLREKKRDRISAAKGEKRKTADISFRSLGVAGHWLSRHYIKSLAGVIVISAVLVYAASKITFDHNYLNLEPKGLKSVELEDTIIDKFDLSIDYGMVLADSPEESRKTASLLKEKPLIASVEDISLYLPSKEEQERRLPHIRQIRKALAASRLQPAVDRENAVRFIDELDRLRMNVMEMQDMAYLGGQDKVDAKCTKITGDPENPQSPDIIGGLMEYMEKNAETSRERLSSFQDVFSPYFRESAMSMSSEDILTLEDLPDSILDRYANRDRNLFLVTAYPAMNIWKDKTVMERFSETLESISGKATGMSIIMKYLIDIMGEDGRKALALTILLVFIILLADFGKPLYAVIAMIPLLLGALWMVGLMKLAGMQFTVMNVLGLPLIIGIGIDDGVHIVHRWMAEGRGAVRQVYASTGKAILLTSLTTMLAFGSLVFSIYRGFASLGGAMFLGVAACFLTSVSVLAPIIGLIDAKRVKKGETAGE